MGVRAGYKQTDIGIVPSDWDVGPLGKRATFRTGPFGSALHKSDYTNNGIPIVNPMHIVDGRIAPTQSMTISEQAATKLADFRMASGDIVMGRRGDMGRCAVVRESEAGWLCGTGSMIVRPLNVNPDFLQRVLSSQRAVTAIKDSSVGTTMVNLNQSTLARLQVQFPPVAEQAAIAEALSDVDALLSGLDRLIAKKRDLKQAAIQQLLTGQTRLPGFHGEWEVKQLGQLGEFIKGSGIRKDEAASGDLAAVRYGEIYTIHHNVVRECRSRISKEVASTAIRLKEGDLLFAGSGETKAEIGKCAAFTDAIEAYAGGDIIILRTNGVCPFFMGYLCNQPAVQRSKASKGQGDAVVHINAAALGSIEVAVPSLAEQTAIAQVLSDMDAELAVLEARREKTRQLKQGMMQELLTGRTRLV